MRNLLMKIQFGDVVEINTSKGLAYAIYTHRHKTRPKYGALIRVFDHLFLSGPVRLPDLLKTPIRFSTFFPLQAAITKGIVKVVGNLPIPESLKPFPLFRSGVIDPKTKRVCVWWLWDGEKSWRVGNLTAEQRKIPIRGVWNDTYLIHRIEEGWRPENDPR
jgi:hypothetical protein